MPDIDVSALIGYPAAKTYLAYVSIVNGEQKAGPPSTIYVRASLGHEAAVQSLLAQTANPRGPLRGERQPAIGRAHRPSRCRRGVQQPLPRTRRGGADRGRRRCRQHHDHLGSGTPLRDRSPPPPRRDDEPRTQFLAESILVAAIGGVVGVVAGAAATAVYAGSKSWAVVIPTEAWLGGITSAILIGALAGLMPAVRASRMPSAVALRTV